MRILGLKPASLMTVMIFMAISRWTYTSLLYWTGAGVLSAYMFENLTRGQPPNFVMHLIYAKLQTPFAQRYLGPFSRYVSKNWVNAGLAPAPGMQDIYEP